MLFYARYIFSCACVHKENYCKDYCNSILLFPLPTRSFGLLLIPCMQRSSFRSRNTSTIYCPMLPAGGHWSPVGPANCHFVRRWAAADTVQLQRCCKRRLSAVVGLQFRVHWAPISPFSAHLRATKRPKDWLPKSEHWSSSPRD